MPGCSVCKPTKNLSEKFGDGETFFIFAQIPEMMGKQRKNADVRQITDEKGESAPSGQSFTGCFNIINSVFCCYGHRMTPFT